MTIADEQSGLQNPVKKFISFKKDKFVYWDKAKGENVEVPMPFEFVAIDELKTVKGWHDPSQSGIYSNEIHSLELEELNVRAFKGGELVHGLWQEIKGDVKGKGGKFAVSIYSLLNGELVNFQLVGASLASWIGKESKGLKFKVSELGEDKKGSVEYKFPIFEKLEITKEEKEEPTRIYKEILKPYFEDYMKKQGVGGKLTENSIAMEKTKTEAEAELPVENNSGISDEQVAKTKEKATDSTDESNLPF